MSEAATKATPDLQAPFPWFGGKRRVARLVWERFGNVANFVEPFAGSLAVLFGRPHAPKVETVNDKDGYLANFWRAVKAEPEAVAAVADWPVNEIDLAARRDYIFARKDELNAMMWRDPTYYDVEIAGLWVWGVCSTIGNAWQPKSTHLGDAGMGVHRPRTHLGAGRGVQLAEYFTAIAARLERVRVMCGDWTRVTSPTVTEHHGVTGVFLDPPYTSDCAQDVYQDDTPVADAVREWAIGRGESAKMRIALCGYEGEHDMPDSWDCIPWKASGGYGSQGVGRGRDNAHRERIWFSPHCIQTELF